MSDELDPTSPLPPWRPSPGAERSPDRIDVLLEQIKTLWKEQPNQRLCQLLCNLADPQPNRLFYIEDHVISEKIFEFRRTAQWPSGRSAGS
jgi:hypothetical protein